MFVACSTSCFSKMPLESALRKIVELEFNKVDLAIDEHSSHLRASDVADHPETALAKLREGPSLTPSALSLDFGSNLNDAVFRRRFESICRLAKPLTVAVVTLPAAPLGSSFDDEVRRLSSLAAHALREGLVLAVTTHSETITADPAAAVELCKAVPGLGLSLDPSHYIQGPNHGKSYDAVFPYVRNVHFRDTGKGPGEFQVLIGQGEIEYGRILNQLERYGYNRALTVALRDDLDSPFDVEVEVRKLKLLLESLL